MLEAICKRPFLRPLLCWVAGSFIFICLPVPLLYLFFLIPAVALVVIGCALSFLHTNNRFAYTYRWTRGIVFILLFLSFAIIFSDYAERHAGYKPFEPQGILQEKAAFFQQRLVDKINTLRLDDSLRSILGSLVVGYRSEMPYEVTRQFAVTGVVHILSVSGFHVAIIAAFVSSLLFYLPGSVFFRWTKFTLTMLFLWIFTYVSGLSAPAVRSAVMLSVFLTGSMLKRNPDKYNTLAATAFCMLVYNPFYLLDIGFQLSFLSVFSLLYLQPKIASRIAVRNPLLASPWNAVAVTLAAQTGTVFLCCFYFGRVSTVFLFTNLPIALLSSVLIDHSRAYESISVGRKVERAQLVK